MCSEETKIRKFIHISQTLFKFVHMNFTDRVARTINNVCTTYVAWKIILTGESSVLNWFIAEKIGR